MLRSTHRTCATSSRASRGVVAVIALLTLAAATGCSSRERRSLPVPAGTGTGTGTPTATATATSAEVIAPGGPTATDTSTSTDAAGDTSTATATNTDASLPPPSAGTGPATSTTTSTSTAANPDGHYDINGANVVVQDLAFTIPSGWTLHQDAVDNGSVILGFARGADYFRIYLKKSAGAFSLGSVVAGGTARSEKIGARDWQRLDAQTGQVAVAAFSLELQGHVYWGFGRAASAAAAAEAVTSFLTSVK